MNTMLTLLLCFALPLAIAMPQGCAGTRAAVYPASQRSEHMMMLAIVRANLRTPPIEVSREDFSLVETTGDYFVEGAAAWSGTRKDSAGNIIVTVTPDCPQVAFDQEAVNAAAIKWGVKRPQTHKQQAVQQGH